MKQKTILLSILSVALAVTSASAVERWVTQNAHISFFSSTPAEDISANNNSVVVVVNAEEDSMGFSVPMQAFEFKKSAMQKHFNQKTFLHTKEFPQATFKGTIGSADDLDLSKEGEYQVTVSGTMSIKGEEKEFSEVGSITVSENSLSLQSEFDLTLADFGIAFKKGKPSKNIAKTVKITINAENLKAQAGTDA